MDGADYLAEGFDGLAFAFGYNTQNRTYDYSTASGLVVKGDGAKYLEKTFFSGKCEDQSRVVSAEIYLECCARWLTFSVTYEGVSFCPETCEAQIDLQKITEASKCYHYLNSTIYWQEGFADAFIHPKVYYCSQPGIAQFWMLSLLPVFVSIIGAIQVIVAVVKTVCEIVTIGFGRCDLGAAEDISICTFFELIGGCGRYATSPLVREILEYHTGRCGLRLQSSILQTAPYNNLALFQLQYERGLSRGDWQQDNAANLTIIQLLELLGPVYNSDYRIIGDALVVERKDYFDNLGLTVGEVKTCFAFVQDTAKAYARFEYTDDVADQQSNRMANEYDDIVEWNAENADWKRGEHTVTAQFGRARFMFDQRGDDRDEDEGFLGDNFIDRFRATNAFNFFGCRDDRRERDLLLTDSRASQLKLLVLEDGFNRNDAFTIRKPFRGEFFAYNYPMYYRQDEPDGLYNKFHAIDDPNTSGRYIYEAEDAVVPWSCNLFGQIIEEQGGYKVSTELGQGVAESIEVNVDGTITVKGIKIKCR